MKVRSLIIITCLLLTIQGFCQKLNKDSVLQTIDVFQNDINNEYADSARSPLSKEDRLKFRGHDFFPVNMDLVVIATLKQTPGQKMFEMPTTTDRKPKYVKYGEVHFKIKGKKYKLNVYQNMDLLNKPEYKDYLFMPFKDLTSGNLSYGGGRYIDLEVTTAKRIIIDFNKAYNPYCAYNHKYSCPIPPRENFLKTSIKAGLKAPKE